MLRISKDLQLPDEAVTQTFAILAKRGVGKTYTASVMVEEMLKNSLHVAIVDPIGVWWGLRTSANGKQAGLPIIVLGGEHGDIPLDPTTGSLVANLVVDEKLSVVIDLSLMRKGEQKRFIIDFAETLYHKNRTALHLVLDEADEFAPQRTFGDDSRMLGAIEDLVRRGRARGIGVTLITQRPAVLNKNVLTQIEVLIAMRLTSPQDRKALEEWVKYHADTESSNDMITQLPTMPVGTAWFWSPGWLDIFEKVIIRKRETLDSSSTPKVGEQKITPTKVAEVDLEALKEQLSATIEKAKSEDPVLLRRKVIDLERQLNDQKPKVEIKEVPVISAEDMDYLKKNFDKFIKIIDPAIGYISSQQVSTNFQISPPVIPMKASTVPSYVKPKLKPTENNDLQITGGAKRMLEVLVSRYPMTFTKSQLATLSKMSPRSGTYSTYLSTLRSNGLVEQSGDIISLTEAGLNHSGSSPKDPQTTQEVLDMWKNNLTGGARRMFEVLIDNYPNVFTKEDLGEATGMFATSGTFGTYLSMLRSNGLIEVEGSVIRASDNLFVGAH